MSQNEFSSKLKNSQLLPSLKNVKAPSSALAKHSLKFASDRRHVFNPFAKLRMNLIITQISSLLTHAILHIMQSNKSPPHRQSLFAAFFLSLYLACYFKCAPQAVKLKLMKIDHFDEIFIAIEHSEWDQCGVE